MTNHVSVVAFELC